LFRGKKHGFGCFTWKQGHVYQGLWEAGERHGLGVFRWADGRTYSGGWQDNEFDGAGVKSEANGTVFEGFFQRGKRHGAGILRRADGSIEQQGWWRHNAFLSVEKPADWDAVEAAAAADAAFSAAPLASSPSSSDTTLLVAAASASSSSSDGSATVPPPLPPPLVAAPANASAAAPASSPSIAEWQPDDAVSACPSCAVEFTFLTRKHHCRACGLVFCDQCTKHRLLLPVVDAKEKVRVCSGCNDVHEAPAVAALAREFARMAAALGPTPGARQHTVHDGENADEPSSPSPSTASAASGSTASSSSPSSSSSAGGFGHRGVYVGELNVGGKFDGFGVLTLHNGSTVYRGRWDDGELTLATCQFPTCHYAGQMRRGKFHAEGVLMETSGRKFEVSTTTRGAGRAMSVAEAGVGVIECALTWHAAVVSFSRCCSFFLSLPSFRPGSMANERRAWLP
jgi:hypothetical protein